MKTDLFHLEILPVDRIVEHEVFDARRMQPILERLQKEQQLINPILVAPMDDGRYLQLDGMNRLTAFRKLKIPAIAAQIVDYENDTQVRLSSWMHLYLMQDSAVTQRALALQKTIAGTVEFQRAGPLQTVNSSSLVPVYDTGWVATIISNKQNVCRVKCTGVDREKAKTILDLVHAYTPSGIIRQSIPDQLTTESLTHLFSIHPQAQGMVLFPTFTKQHIISLVKDGGLLPAGVTRHVVKNRCLNVNVPLALLTDGTSLPVKNDQLNALLSSRQIRQYEESIVYIE